MALHNRVDKRLLRARIQQAEIPRTTFSFYRYVQINDPATYRDELYRKWEALGCLGRIYIAQEGVNAQMNVPTENWEAFVQCINEDPFLANVPFKIAVEDDPTSFYKLKIKIRPKIVADGLDDKTFNPWDTGNHLTARQFNEAMDEGAIVVDMRNHYESEVGHFVGAIKPDADTFREELEMVQEILKGKEEQKILMYCTGGIRCEKASAYFKHLGYKDVNQLQGGIISYAHQINEEGLPSKYIGKNFVFDERLGERITEDVIAHCHQCGTPCDDHTNCLNEDCHLLFIQCPACKTRMENCCSDDCIEMIHLPMEEQKAKRKGQNKGNAQNIFKKGRVEAKIKTSITSD